MTYAQTRSRVKKTEKRVKLISFDKCFFFSFTLGNIISDTCSSGWRNRKLNGAREFDILKSCYTFKQNLYIKKN